MRENKNILNPVLIIAINCSITYNKLFFMNNNSRGLVGIKPDFKMMYVGTSVVAEGPRMLQFGVLIVTEHQR